MKRASKTESSAPFAGPHPDSGPRPGKSIYWILGGLVVAGVTGWWRWLRSLPKD
jgi:hypothetical protein